VMSALCQRRTHAPIHSIISLAVASGACATFRPSAFAVFRFMPNSNLVGLAPRLRTTRKIKAIRKGNCDQRNGSADSLQRANGGRTKSFLVRIRHREGKYPTSALPLAADADRSAVLFWQRSPGNARAVFSALWQSIKACIQCQVHHARTPCVIRCSCLYLRRCR